VWRLLPEWKAPGELAVLDHSLVTAPSGINQYVEPIARPCDSLKDTRSVTVPAMIALDPNYSRREISRIDASTGSEDSETLGC
jgi:hypothetical protein